jgi:hypothetical protein
VRTKTLIILAIVAVLAVVGALLLEKRTAPDTAVAYGELLYPGLKGLLNDVSSIEINQPDNEEPVVLERTESGWIVVPRAGYAADAGKIRQLLLRLADARIAEVKTANPELYPRLGVADSGDGAGTVLVLGPPAELSLIVGNRDAAGGERTYVRRQGEAQSYLVDVNLDVNRPEADWLDRDLFDVDASAISKVVITMADGQVLELFRVGERLVVAGMPEGRELSNPGATQPIARALAGLRFDDVVPAAEFDGGDPEATAEFHLDDGRRITARGWHKDDARWLAFSVSMDPAPGNGDTPDEETEITSEQQEDGDTGAHAAGGPDSAGKDDQALPERADPEAVAQQDAALAGWVFKVPVHRYEQMVRRKEDLLKPEAE